MPHEKKGEGKKGKAKELAAGSRQNIPEWQIF
jgi:hypothetical protein